MNNKDRDKQKPWVIVLVTVILCSIFITAALTLTTSPELMEAIANFLGW